jgi:hypothetical protein
MKRNVIRSQRDFNVPTRELEQKRVLAFAGDWIDRNIDVGPFSRREFPIYDRALCQFNAEAVEAGFTQAKLECAVGSVREFVMRAFTRAASKWHAAEEVRHRGAHKVVNGPPMCRPCRAYDRPLPFNEPDPAPLCHRCQ